LNVVNQLQPLPVGIQDFAQLRSVFANLCEGRKDLFDGLWNKRKLAA